VSKKEKLSDNFLDSIAGGTLTYGDKEISMMHGTTEGAAVTYADGTQALLEWKDEFKGMMQEGGRDAINFIVERQSEMMYRGTYTLDDYVK